MRFPIAMEAVIILIIAASYSGMANMNNEAEFYTFKTRIVQTNKGVFGAASIKIERAPEQYFENAIIIKTIENKVVSSNQKSFSGTSLTQAISDLNIKSIRNPIASSLKAEDPFALSNIYEVYFDSPVDPYDVCRELMQNPEIEYASPIYKREIHKAVSDPQAGVQYHLKEMNAEAAWDITTGDKDVVIAIVDSGVQTDHPDLAANIWTNPDEIANDGIDNDGNGKIDDIHGWDMVGNISQSDIAYGRWAEDNNPSPGVTTLNHGTHVAGCAAAVTDNAIGIASLGFNCSILPVKCSSESSSSGIYRGYEGIAYAADLGADIINCSWGGLGQAAYEQEIIDDATSKGSLVITSAGNESSYIDLSPTYPANYKNVLTVGATKAGGDITFFSNYGIRVDVYAAGNDIYSTLPGSKYGKESGTSMSSPIVSGLAGLIKSLHPDWEAMQVAAQIRATADLVSKEKNMDNKFYCIANAYKALSVNNPINNKNGETTPGLKIFTYNQGNNMDFVFDGYVEKNLNIYVINYLSDATNVTVELEPLDNFIKLSETSFKFCDIESLYDEKISLKATLLDNCPWSEGYAYVLVKYKADNYEDFELMKLDIKTNQKTTFSKLSTKGDAPDFTDWTDIASADGSNFWCVGAGEEAYYGYLLKYNKVGGISASYLQTPAYDIEVINSSTAFVASNGRYDISKVSKTTNGGTSWTNCLTDSLTDFINQIHFYSATNGIFLGNPKDGKWCVASTTDAGETWQRYSSFEALSDEISYPKSNCFNFGDIYFGTSEGRLFFSEDAGAAWSVKTVLPGKEIHFVEFIDKNRGIIIYSNKGDASRQFIAKTNDGGNNWTTEIKSFSGDNKIINTFRPQDGDVIYVVNHKGEVFSSNNLFDSMQPILSKRTQQVAVNGLYAKSGKGTLLQFGDFITSLEFNYDKKDAKSDLSVVTSRDLNFGYVEPGTSSSQQVILLASGNQNSYISTSEIENVDCEDGEFSIESNFPINMNSGTYAAGIIKFTPNSKGLKTARLIINNNSEESRIVVNLKGAGDPISSVDGGVAIKKAISVFPNPAKEEVSFKFEIALLSETANVKINDIKGQNVLTFDNLQLNDKLITVDCSELNSGTYFADFEIGGKKYLTKFVISK